MEKSYEINQIKEYQQVNMIMLIMEPKRTLKKTNNVENETIREREHKIRLT